MRLQKILVSKGGSMKNETLNPCTNKSCKTCCIVYRIFYILVCAALISVASVLFFNAMPLPLAFKDCVPMLIALAAWAVVLCLDLFIHAGKGILLGVKTLPTDKYPLKPALINTAIYSACVAVLFWAVGFLRNIPFPYADSKLSFGDAVLLFSLLSLATFFLVYIALNACYFLAYKIAVKTKK